MEMIGTLDMNKVAKALEKIFRCRGYNLTVSYRLRKDAKKDGDGTTDVENDVKNDEKKDADVKNGDDVQGDRTGEVPHMRQSV